MQRLPSGHYTIDVLNCGHQDWQVPDAAVQVGRRIEEFRIGSQHGGDHQLFGRFCCHPGARHEPHAAVAVRRAAGQHGRLVQCIIAACVATFGGWGPAAGADYSS